MLEYPKRPRFFAFRFCRLMIEQELATELGAETCYLLTTIAMGEDAKGYRSPVTWYNEPLSKAIGCGSVDSLDRIRRRAVDSGWLHYVRGGKYRAGRYWVVIPPQLCGNKAQEPDYQFRTGAEIRTEQESQFRTGADSDAEMAAEMDAEMAAEHSSLVPVPLTLDPLGDSPLTPRRSRTKRSKPESNGYCKAFERFWEAYPRREGKRKAYESWKAAGKRIKESKGLSSRESASHLLERAEAYRDSARGRWPLDKIPHPTTWLNQDRFDDDPGSWQVEYNVERPAKVQGEFGRNQAVLEAVLRDYAEGGEVFDG